MARPKWIDDGDDIPVATRQAPRHLFDITLRSIIGRIYEGAEGDRHPQDVAFTTISEYVRTVPPHEGPMVFEFPSENGPVMEVTITYHDPPATTA